MAFLGCAALLASGALQQPISIVAPTLASQIRAPVQVAMASEAATSRRALLSSIAALGAVSTQPAWAGYVTSLVRPQLPHARRGRHPTHTQADASPICARSTAGGRDMLTRSHALAHRRASRRPSRRTRRRTASCSTPSRCRTTCRPSRSTAPRPPRSARSSRPTTT